MLRLLVKALRPGSYQTFPLLKSVSTQQPLQFLRPPFLPPQNLFYQPWIRNYHRSTFLGKGQKDPKKKAPHPETCAKDTAKYQKSSKNTMRPEDASSASNKARVCKPPRQTPAPPQPPPPFPKKGSPPICPSPRTCPPREVPRICGQPPPKPSKPADKGKKRAPTPPPPKNAPQPTRTVLPRQMARNYDMPPQQECPYEVTWPTRPVITRIRVCTPEEVRKMVTPPTKYIPCPEIYEVLTFKEKVMRVISFILTVGFTTLLVWLMVDLGFWASSDETLELLNSIRGVPAKEPAPSFSVIMYRVKQVHNRIVKNVFWVLMNIPEVLKRIWRYIRAQDDEAFDVKQHLPDLHDSAPYAPLK